MTMCFTRIWVSTAFAIRYTLAQSLAMTSEVAPFIPLVTVWSLSESSRTLQHAKAHFSKGTSARAEPQAGQHSTKPR
jgi:uncharacterized membrane protein